MFVTNYMVDRHPREAPLIPVDCHHAITWHKGISPKRLGPVDYCGAVASSVHLYCVRHRFTLNGATLLATQYRFNVLGYLYAEHVRNDDAFTRLCDIYEREERLALRSENADVWTPSVGTLESKFRDPLYKITHAHVLAALLMNDPVVEQFKPL